MRNDELAPILARLLSELLDGANVPGAALTLNSGDKGLLRSLADLSADEASRSALGGATIAAHAQHLRYGLSLMNRWSVEGKDAYANPLWDEAWKISAVDDAAWKEIRGGLESESRRWLATVGKGRELAEIELAGMISSIIHLAYHLGAMRQIAGKARGPKEGTFR